MTLRDLIVTPLLLILIFMVSIPVSGRIADRITRRYFYPAMIVRVLGAIFLGLIYQFYYKGGDTFVFFDQGSYYIWKAFLDSPLKGLSLVFSRAGDYMINTYEYSSKIVFFTDPSSYFVIRIASLLDLLTFHTYSATAILFALFSFSGSWFMYKAFYRMYPKLHLQFALAIFFIPSVVFWGSGLMNDSLTMGAVCWAVYGFINLFIEKKSIGRNIVILFLSFYLLYIVKIYILMCLLPPLLIWLYIEYITSIRNLVLRVMLLPVILVLVFIAGFYSVIKVSSENTRYNLTSLTQTAKATASWISYVSNTEGGSTYTLGDYDFSPKGVLKKSYKAIWVTLFRPYLWESKNPVMLLSAVESLFFLLFTLYALINAGPAYSFKTLTSNPVAIFSLVFALTFSFAVGVSTYNFGSLVRYKIPMMPFYMIAMILILYSRRPRKLARLDAVQ